MTLGTQGGGVSGGGADGGDDGCDDGGDDGGVSGGGSCGGSDGGSDGAGGAGGSKGGNESGSEGGREGGSGGHSAVCATYLVSPVRCEPLHVDLATKQHPFGAMLISAQPSNAAHACLHPSKLVLQMRHPDAGLLSNTMLLPRPSWATLATSAWSKSFSLWVLPHQ